MRFRCKVCIAIGGFLKHPPPPSHQKKKTFANTFANNNSQVSKARGLWRYRQEVEASPMPIALVEIEPICSSHRRLLARKCVWVEDHSMQPHLSICCSAREFPNPTIRWCPKKVAGKMESPWNVETKYPWGLGSPLKEPRDGRWGKCWMLRAKMPDPNTSRFARSRHSPGASDSCVPTKRSCQTGWIT